MVCLFCSENLNQHRHVNVYRVPDPVMRSCTTQHLRRDSLPSEQLHKTPQEQEANVSNHFLHRPEAATLTEELELS